MSYQIAVDACGEDIGPQPPDDDNGDGAQKPGPNDEVILNIPNKPKLAKTGGFPLSALLAVGMIIGGIALIRRR